MRLLAAQLAVVFAALAIVAGSASTDTPRANHKRQLAAAPQKHTRKPEPPPLPCGDYVGFQVLLDRQGFAPGQIDGRPGENFSHAVAALQAAHKLQPSGEPDCDTWHALGADQPRDPRGVGSLWRARRNVHDHFG